MWFLKTAATMKPRKLPHLKNWCGSYQSKRIHILTFAGDKSSEGERIEQPGVLTVEIRLVAIEVKPDGAGYQSRAAMLPRLIASPTCVFLASDSRTGTRETARHGAARQRPHGHGRVLIPLGNERTAAS
jgi:hypothetical protein